MGHANGVITAPVNTDDVRLTIGHNSDDVATLCSSSQIKKWAKWKPVRYNKIGELTEAERKSVAFGLAFGYIAQSTSAAVNLLANLQTGLPSIPAWTYAPPRPGTDWCRLTDFLNSNSPSNPGYNHNAKPPMSGFTDITLFKSEFGSESKVYPFNFKYGPSSNQGVNDTSGIEIPINELNSAITDGTWRMALLIYFPQNGKYRVAVGAANSAISDSAQPGAMMIRPANTGELSSLYTAAWNAGVRTLDAIPCLAKDLSRTNASGSADRWTFQASSQIISMPNGERIKINLSDRFTNVAITLNSIKIEYLDNGGTVKKSYNLYPVGSTSGGMADTTLALPSSSSSVRCRITLDFNISGSMASSDRVLKDKLKVGLSGILIDTAVTTLEQTTNSGSSWSSISQLTALSGRYRVVATDSQTGSRSALMNSIESLPRRSSGATSIHIYPTVSLDGVKFNTGNYFIHHG